MNVRGKTRF